ncbi:MAG TPA: aldo/keto reductase [Thermomonas sp.]|nr:aldo/keto reductase [Thermomonas sp.]
MTHAAPILGSMRFGSWGAKLSPAGVATLLEGALDAGIDTLDLADIYGDHATNPLVGEALALRPGLRQRLRLLAKVGIAKTDSPGNPRGVQHYDLSVRHLRAALDASLRDLRTDHVDVLMLHRFDPLLEPAAIAGWVREEQAAGRIGAFGVSNFGPHALALFDGRLDIVANQVELSLANSVVIGDGTLHATQARGAEVQAWSPLGGGGLLQPPAALGDALRLFAGEFGLDAASLLLRWVASVPGTRVVIGSSDSTRIRAAVDACASPLPKDAWYALWEAARGFPVP